MAKILIVYGTTEGHTAQVALRMAKTLRAAGHDVDVCDSKDVRKWTVESGYDGVLVGGSVHAGEHQSSVREFVRHNRDILTALPSAFFSVSLTAAEATDESRRETQAVVDKFVRETGWWPERVETFAGALVYSQYNFFMRHVMHLIVMRQGQPTDMSRDYDYTDWDAVEQFARDFGAAVAAKAASAPAP